MVTTTARPVRTTNRDAAQHIAAGTPFRTGTDSLRGGVVIGPLSLFGPGYLPISYADTLRSALKAGPVYVVWSYGTPIAWRPLRSITGWVIPDVKYSRTTSRHQGIARRAAL